MNVLHYPHIRENINNNTNINDWYRGMLHIAIDELKLLKQNPEYKISSDSMHIIESLAYFDNYLNGIMKPDMEDKRNIYYAKAIEYKGVLPKSSEFRFNDGSYMATWYQEQNKKARAILKRLETLEDYSLSSKDYELIKWFYNLHNHLKDIWLEDRLRSQKEEQNKEKYKNWVTFSDAVGSDPSLLKTKKLCEGIEIFYSLDEFYMGVENRMKVCAEKNFSYSSINMQDIEKHLALKN